MQSEEAFEEKIDQISKTIEQYSSIQKRNMIAKIIISFVCIVLFLVKFLRPELKIDNIALGFIVVAILPWASSFIQKLDISGIGKIEFQAQQSQLKEVKEKLEMVMSASSEPQEDKEGDTQEPSNDEKTVFCFLYCCHFNGIIRSE